MGKNKRTNQIQQKETRTVGSVEVRKMNGLEALERLTKDLTQYTCDNELSIGQQEDYNIIEKELKEYESYKGFLDNVEKGAVTYTPRDIWEEERKKLKAFEIIIKTLPAFVYAITNSKDYQDYSSHYISPIITQEQYDLLKEVLKDE